MTHHTVSVKVGVAVLDQEREDVELADMTGVLGIDGEALRFRTIREFSNRRLRNELGLGARDEDAGSDRDGRATERRRAEQVLKRHP